MTSKRGRLRSGVLMAAAVGEESAPRRRRGSMIAQMAVHEPAHPLEKRDLLHADPPNPAKIDAIATQMNGSGRAAESIDYVEITHNPSLLAKSEADAVSRGSAWLLAQVERIRGTKSSTETWVALSASAAKAERWYDAVRALQSAGLDADAEAIRAVHCPDYEPFKPLGK